MIEYSDEEPIEVIRKISNERSTKELTKELIEESDEELIKAIGKVLNGKLTKKLFEELDKYSDDSDEYSDEELDEIFKEITKIKKPNKDESTTDWYDKNKFKKIPTAIDRNGFNYKNKIGKLRFNDINNLINDIKNNTFSEAFAKQKLNALNEIKKTETKNKCLINGQKILLNLFDDLLETIYFVKKENNDNNNNISVNENENDCVNKNENESIDKIDDNVDTYNYFNIIDKTKSFEDQIGTLKKLDDLSQYWNANYCDDNKKLNFNIFRQNLHTY